ncbi:MAG TPA: ABC transporter permease [Terriglobales bacterium]|nr:ABC transporter permease [Terriglobales bacterium]
MSAVKPFLAGLRSLFRKQDVEQELDDELQDYFQRAVQQKIESGVDPARALREARIEMGSTEATKERVHESGWQSIFESIAQDLHYGLRTLRKNPGFTIVAVTTLALGIAANATIFSFVNAVMLQPPAVHDADSVVVVYGTTTRQSFSNNLNPISSPNYFAWKSANRVFSEVAAIQPWQNVNLTGTGEPEQLNSVSVTANFFSLLGVPAALGRTFEPGEDQKGDDRVAVLSYGLWTRRFASDPNLPGKTIGIDGEQYTVVGIMPKSFSLRSFPAEIWTPLVLDPAQQDQTARQKRSYFLFGRLKPHTTTLQAQANFVALAGQAAHDFPATDGGWSAGALTLQDYMTKEFNAGPAIAILICTVAFVLLIACANISGLLLARATARRKEIALRMALGAGRARIVRQLMLESLILAIFGGSLGVLLSFWGAALFRAKLNFNVETRLLKIQIDTTVLLFTVGISVLAAFLFGLVPALQTTRSDMNSTLKDSGAAVSATRGRNRLRRLLVAGECALAVFLLSGSGIMIHALYLSWHEYLGFNSDHLLTAGITLPVKNYSSVTMQHEFFTNLLQKTAELPGTQSSALTSDLPGTGAAHDTFTLQGEDLPPAKRPRAVYFVVSPGYLAAAQIPLLRGRDFARSDNSSAPKVAIVNAEFARRFFPGVDPIGKTIRIDTPDPERADWRMIIGIAGNVKNFSLQHSDDPEVYESYLQHPATAMNVVVRTAGDPGALAPSLRQAVYGLDKDLPLSDVESMTKLLNTQETGDHFFTAMLATFAGLALLLAAIGIYGMVAYSVGQRTREIGIRMAMGAQRKSILRMVVAQGAWLALIGGGIGLAMSLPLPQAFSAMFQDFYVTGTQVFIAVPLVIALTALLACYIPARRAVKVDPTRALRCE